MKFLLADVKGNEDPRERRGSYFLGVDIGGTKTLISIGSESEVIGSTKFATQAALGFDNFVEEFRIQFAQLCKSLEIDPRLISKGAIGSPGLLNESRGVVMAAVNLGWRDQPIVDALKRVTNVEHLELAVDTRCAAVAEIHSGVGREVDDFIYVTSSTGIGCSIVQKGQIWKGSHGFAGELGQTLVLNQSANQLSTLESLVSGSGIKSRSGFDAIELEELARAGDKHSIEQLEEAGRILGIAVFNLFQILDPQVIVVGGGLMLGSNFYFEAFSKSVQAAPPKSTSRKYRIVKTSLGESAGASGAMLMAIHGKEIFFS